jgi:hypothetical protein
MIALIFLVVLVVYILIAVLITLAIAKRQKNAKAKWLAAFFTLAVFVLIPTWDWLLGSIYLQYLCAKEGGAKVYKTVEVGPEFILKPGDSDYNTAGRLPAKGGELNVKKLTERFSFMHSSEQVSSFFRIEKDTYVIKDIVTGDVMGTSVSFLFFGGWFQNNFAPHVTGDRCPRDIDYNQFHRNIFKPI